MASTQDAIRRLTIQASAPGATQATAELQALAAAQGGVAVASATTERATTSLDSKFASIERRYNTALRNQQDYAKIQAQVNAAVAQNPALQDRANAVLAAAADRYGQVTGAQKAFGIASQTVNLQIAALASGLGLTGQILSAFGPWGFAAAVGLGAVQSALSLASEKSHALAEKAKEIKEFSEAAGLTTTQFQALRSEAGKFGIDSESLASGLTKFTAGFENLRLGQGDLLTQVRRVNPAIADQMQQTTDAATAFTLFGKAVDATSNIFQRNALLKAGMGKGASTFGAFFESQPDVLALGAAAEAAGKGIDENLINKLKQLQIDIDKTRSAANSTFSMIFGASTLEGERAYAQGLLEIAKYAREFVLSKDLHKLIDYKVGANAGTALSVGAGAATGAAIGATGGAFLGGVGAIPGAVAGGLAGAIAALISDYTAQEIKKIAPGSLTTSGPTSMANFVSPANSYSAFQAPKTEVTDEAKIEKMQKQIALLGSAATASEKYKLAVEELNLKVRDAAAGDDVRNRALASLSLEKATALQSAHNSALGASLPVQDAVNARMLELARLQQQGAGLTPKQIADQQSLAREQALGTLQIKSQIDAVNVQTATIDMSAGAAAEYTARQTLLNDAIRNHKVLTDADKAAIDEQAKALGRAVQAGALKSAQSQANFTTQTLFMSPTDIAAANVMHNIYGPEWQSHMDDALAKQIKMNSQLGEAKDTAQQFASSFVQGLLQGKSGMDALVGAADALASKMADKALTDLFSGNFLQAGVEAVVAVGASIFSGDAKNKKALAEAQAEWKAAGPAFQKFLKEMSGGVQGGLSVMFDQLAEQANAFAQKAAKAHDQAGVDAAYAAFNVAVLRTTNAFKQSFGGMLDAINAGLGPNSPFASGASNIKQVGETLKGFIDDARSSYANSPINLASGYMTYEQMGGGADAQMAAATEASRKYLVSLLGAAPVLTETATAIQTMQGSAVQLRATLSELGMSADEAAKAINAGVAAAMAALADKFSAGLTARLNTAMGKTYLNDATALIAQNVQDMTDAAALGISQSSVAAVFAAEAQKIVNDAGLVGDAFTDFTRLFPQLAGVVTETTADVAAALTTLNASAKSVVDYINGLNSGSSSTLAPGDRLNAAQAAYNAKLALAQAGNADAQGSITGDAEALRTAARDFYGSTVGYQAILDGIKNQLLALPAVQQTTDPVVQAMRDVLIAVQATTGAVVAMQGALIGGLAANSPSAIAGAFLSSGAVGLTFDQFKAGFPAGLATDAQLANVYNATVAAGLAGLTFDQFKAGFPTGLATDAQLHSIYDATVAAGNVGLTFAQFKAGFPPGLATDSTLGGLYTALDTNKNGIVSQLELLQAALKPAIDSGNAASIATALGSYFDVIATNTDAGITLGDMQVALAGMASVSVLRDMFMTIDQDNSGSIDKLELIKAASQATRDSTASAAAQSAQANAMLNYANSLGESANSIGNYSANLLISINGLQSTASQQLTLLNTQYGQSVTTASVQSGFSYVTISADNTVMSALNKITINTFATAQNTWSIGQSGYRGWTYIIGAYADGGRIGGAGTPTSDSNVIRASVDEFMIKASSARSIGYDALTVANDTGRLPVMPVAVPVMRSGNDNSSQEVLAELRALRKELAEIKGNTGRTVSAVIGSGARIKESVEAGNVLHADTNKRARRA